MESIIDDPNFELLGDLSTEDFQKRLYHWLEERGTLPILRTYLRHQLISTLKHTHPRSTLLSRKRNHLSPKVHAINLLMAEYLLEQNYHFTVSIFHSEEPRIGHVPLQSEPAAGLLDSSTYLQTKDIEDILGTLNLRTDSKLGKKVVGIYFGEKKKGKSTSLIRAIFEALCETEFSSNIGQKVSTGDAGSRRTGMDEDQQFFSAVSAEPEIKPANLGISAKIQLPETKGTSEISQSYGENLKKYLMEWNQKEFERRIKEEVGKIREGLEKETASQKKKFKEDVLLKQQQFLDIMNQLRDQQTQIKQHLKQIQHKEEELRDKETKLEETQKQETARIANKHNDIVRAQQQLVEDFKRLTQEQNTVKCLQKDIEAWHNQVLETTTGQPPNLLHPHNLEQQPKNDRKGLQQQASVNNSDTMSMVHSMRSLQQEAIWACQWMISEVKDKNETLQMLADEQQSKINTLSSTASQMSKELEEARAALRLLSSRDSHPSYVDPKSSIEERVTVLSMMQDDNKRPKEEFRRQKESMVGRSNRFRHLGGNHQRKHVRANLRHYRHHSSESDSSTASSPTEEIIKEARRRLECLEKESDEVDKQFFKLRQKHLAEADGSSGIGYSGIFPGTLRESDPSLPLYNYVPATQNVALPMGPPYQLLHSNVALKVVDGFKDSQPHQKEEAQFHHGPMKTQPHISTLTNLNPNFPHPTVGSWQSSLRTEIQPDEPMPSTGGIYNNNTLRDYSGHHVLRMETAGNTSHTVKAALPSSSGAPVGFEDYETNLTFNNDQRQNFQSQNDFPAKDNQRSVHFEIPLDKKNGNNDHIREKNHLSAMNLETNKNNTAGEVEERIQKKTIGRAASVMVDPLSSPVVHLSKENNKKKDNSNDNPHVDSKEPTPIPTLFRTHVSVSTGEDSSSPKLSIGIDDSKENDNSEFW